MISLRGLTEEQRQEILVGANYHLAQGYNKRCMMPGTLSSSFCSELAAKAYKRAGLVILGGKEPSQVAPAHFDVEADRSQDWENVTADYRQLLSDIEKQPETYLFGFMMLASSLQSLHRTNARTEMMFKFAENFGKTDEFKTKIKEIRRQLDGTKSFSY